MGPTGVVSPATAANHGTYPARRSPARSPLLTAIADCHWGQIFIFDNSVIHWVAPTHHGRSGHQQSTVAGVKLYDPVQAVTGVLDLHNARFWNEDGRCDDAVFVHDDKSTKRAAINMAMVN